jgi:hypothetical protein
MEIFTKNDLIRVFNESGIDTSVIRLSDGLQLVRGAYSSPLESGVQIALARLFAYWLFDDAPVCLYIVGWGVATEHQDLFYGYRRSLGETRSLSEAPIHIFGEGDENTFISLMSLVLFFSWDAWIFNNAKEILIRTSHDGWLEIRAKHDEAFLNHIATEMESYDVRLLA